MNIDLPTAKRLAEGVRCPTCGGKKPPWPCEWDRCRTHGCDGVCERPCPTCDDEGRLYWKGEWPQLCWCKEYAPHMDGEHWYTYYAPKLTYRLQSDPAAWYPAPHPVDVLMWLESVGVLTLGVKDPHAGRWVATNPHYMRPGSWITLSADDPSALLTAVLDSLAR